MLEAVPPLRVRPAGEDGACVSRVEAHAAVAAIACDAEDVLPAASKATSASEAETPQLSPPTVIDVDVVVAYAEPFRDIRYPATPRSSDDGSHETETEVALAPETTSWPGALGG